MTYNVACLPDPYNGTFKIVDVANDYIEAWRRAAAARRLQQGDIFFVLITEAREDPERRPRRLRSNPSFGRSGRL